MPDVNYIGMMEKKMEVTVVYWGYIGIMEKKMETTIIVVQNLPGITANRSSSLL